MANSQLVLELTDRLQILAGRELTYLLMAAKGLSKLSGFSEKKIMSSDIAEIDGEETRTLNPLDFIPDENTISMCLMGSPVVTGASPSGYSGRRSRGQEAELEK